MIALTSVDLFNILRQKIGEKEAKAVTEYIEVQVEEKSGSVSLLINKDLENLRQDMNRSFATKEDMHKMNVDIMKSIYFVGLIQFLSILISVLAIIKWVK
jgi:hypothetical protein